MLLALCFMIVYGVLALVSVAGWIWLVVRAFGKSAGWGLAMLFFSPIAAIVAAVRDWTEWKRPFLLYYGSFGAQILVVIVSMIALPLASPFGRLAGNAAEPTLDATAAPNETVGDRVAAPEPSAPRNPAQAELAAPLTRAEAAPAVQRERTDPTGRPPSASMTGRVADLTPGMRNDDESNAVPDGFDEVAVATASTRIGSIVRLVARDGRIHKGTLTDVENGRLHMRFEMSGGSIAMDFAPAEIRSLQIRR
jgi:hypothetical protein